MYSFLIEEDEAVWEFSTGMLFDQLLAYVAFKRSKFEVPRFIAFQNEVYWVTAKEAVTIVK